MSIEAPSNNSQSNKQHMVSPVVVDAVLAGASRPAANPVVQPIFGRIARDERSVGFLAVATIAERLGRITNAASVPFDDYLHDLAGDLEFTLCRSGRGILTCTASRIMLPVGPAITLGLIAEQLVGHALGHEFPPDQDKRIALSFGATATAMRLVVDDNGTVDRARPGRRDDNLLIARLLVLQLDGTLETAAGKANGSQCIVTVPRLGPNS